MMTMFAVLSGILQAGLFALVVRLVGARHRLWLHTGMLLLAAVLYVVFATNAGAWGQAGIEVLGLIAFGGTAILALVRRSPGLLALGWALHPLWDIVLHTSGTMEAYTPHGYVAACFGFDLLLVLVLWRGWSGIAVARRQGSPATERPARISELVVRTGSGCTCGSCCQPQSVGGTVD